MAKLTLDDGTVFEGTVEEIQKFLNKPRLKYKVGDYVWVVNPLYLVSEGVVAEIVEVDMEEEEGFPYRIKEVGGSGTTWCEEEDIELLTEEEKITVDKWLEIGRKPFEYKEGDIVVSKASERLGIVSYVDNENHMCRLKLDFHEYNDYYKHDIALIVPVEQRFDLR